MRTFKVYRYDVSLDCWARIAFNTTEPTYKDAHAVAAMFHARSPTQLHRVVDDNNSVAFSSIMLADQYMMMALETSGLLRLDLEYSYTTANRLQYEASSAKRVMNVAIAAMLAFACIAAFIAARPTKIDDALKATIATQDYTLSMCTKTLAATATLGKLDAALADRHLAEAGRLQTQLAAANADVATCWTVASDVVEVPDGEGN